LIANKKGDGDKGKKTDLKPTVSSCLLFLFLRQPVLFEKGRNFIPRPQMVIYHALLRLPDRGKFNYTVPELAKGNQRRQVDKSPKYEQADDLLFSLLSFVESMVLLRTLAAIPQASFKSQSSL
jgi:hypothetical protein